MHMQDAWVVDQATKGSWTQIGFEAPTSKNFTYTDNSGDFKATGTGFTKCTSNDWTVTTTVNASTKTASYQASDNCPALTPNFKNIGTSS